MLCENEKQLYFIINGLQLTILKGKFGKGFQNFGHLVKAFAFKNKK